MHSIKYGFATTLLAVCSVLVLNNLNAQKMIDNKTALNASQCSIAIISALTAKGDLQQLSTALNNGLDAGLTINEEKEVLIHLYAYCGFPRSLQGINTLMAVVEERRKKGIEDKVGKQATPIIDTSNKYQRGKATLQTLTGQPEKEPKTGYAAFSPEIEVFLKEHLFADIFSRDVLDYQSREIATVSALIGLGGVEPMMQSHMAIALHIGITKRQLEQLLSVTEKYVSEANTASGRKILSALPNSTNSENSSALNSTPIEEDNAGANTINKEDLFPKGNKVTNDNFSGTAWLHMLVTDGATYNATVGNVTFEPGVRNNWHKHPGGQILLATSGVGYYQEKGKPIQLLHKGDVIQCPPNVEHWHGAAPNSQFTHIAITPNNPAGAVIWLQPVTDAEYNTIK